ncbi:hypothetical protein [Croceicoccus mobilis]|uniref:DUF4229 domain-containing protein n=1 Tax=Croceicoccus mobilis TaxID=1703339 RepID=A0A916YR60_9SPHN|nr:hypothetical protein [Croceicoccus mobilis]GGD56626.1 hypothetical protein GCM10010990_02310 [Croceicoccus mobilis]
MNDPAASRFFTIQLLRMAGVAVVVYALLVLQGSAPWPDGVPRWIAYVMLVAGLTDALLVPTLLSRVWSSRRIDQRREHGHRNFEDQDK